jgi:mevalonate kinase
MSEDGAIPPAGLPLAVRAPGKCILFGEHSVVHGGPELVAAIDLFVQVGARRAETRSLNGSVEALSSNPYLVEALDRLWVGGTPLALTVTSRIPRAAGLGSSAAFSSALAALFGALQGGLPRPLLAERAFEVERTAQGVGSPGDTSATVAGGYISLNAGEGPGLWSVTDGERSWTVRRVEDPGWLWVVAYTGIPRNTGETVRAVGRRLGEPDGPALLERFRSVALAGIEAVGKEEPETVGRLLDENQQLLREVGVSHPRIEALLEAAAPASLGGKLTGAGAGGSIVVLPKPGRDAEVVRRIARAGGVPFAVRVEPMGARLVEAAVGGTQTAGSLPGDDP